MLKKTIRRLGALAMVLALAVSVFAVNAFAATEAITSLDFTKIVTCDDNTLAPATSFEFTVTAATADQGETYDDAPVYSGVQAAVSVVNPAAFGPRTAKSQNGSINFYASEFTKPGVYKYTVAETKGDYDGITYDTAERTMYVYVQNGANGSPEVIGAIMLNDDEKSVDFENTYETADLTVKKVITGGMADMNSKWEITVVVNGAEGEQYKTSEEGVTLTSGTPKTFILGNDETVTIYGLSANDEYQVTEDDANTDGYTTTYESCNEDEAGAMGTDDVTATVTNTRETTPPTGVIMTIAPYALMVVLAGAFAVVFLTRRNRAE